MSLARLVRLPNVFTATADVSVGLLVTHSAAGHASSILLSSCCLYASGMAWNDYFDRRLDAVERPNRPIPSGAVSPATAVWVAGTLMLVGIAAAFSASLAAGWHALALSALILAYDAWLKATPIGPVAMAGCRVANVLLGFGGSEAPISTRLALAGIVGVYVLGITIFARDEALRSRSIRLIVGAAVCGIAIILAAASPSSSSSQLYLLTALGLVIAHRAMQAVADPGPRPVQRFVKAAILGLIALDAALAVSLAGPIGFVILVCLLPAMILGRWLYST